MGVRTVYPGPLIFYIQRKKEKVNAPNSARTVLPVILVVDDLRDFGEEFEGHQIIYARSSQAALAMLAGIQPEEVWLDHDLGGDPEEPDDTRPVVRAIEKTAKRGLYSPRIRILTSNPVGRQYIKLSLSGCCEIIDGVPRSYVVCP